MRRRFIRSDMGLGLNATICLLLLCTSLVGCFQAKWRVLTEEKNSHAVSFNSVMFFDDLNGLALTALGLERTTDGGKTWVTALAYNSERGLYSMVFTDRDSGWIVGTEVLGNAELATSKNHRSLLLSTEDGGSNWKKININEDSLTKGNKRFSAFLDICIDKDGKSWIVGDGGLVEGFIEHGTLKVSDVVFTEHTLNNVLCTESGEVWAVGDGGLLMHFRNTWKREMLNKDAFFVKVRISGDYVWLVGGVHSKDQPQTNGLLLRGNGQTWEDKSPSSAGSLSDLYLTASEGWLVGSGGTIFHTNNAGETWQKERSPTNNDLLDIFFLNPNRGWIAGNNLTILGLNN